MATDPRPLGICCSCWGLRPAVRVTTLSVRNLVLGTVLCLGSIRVQATVYHVSSSEGDDGHFGSIGQPLASLEALNSLTLQPGDSVLFKAGDSWNGMFWPKGSGTLESPIVIDRYGEGAPPILDGDGYQAAILLYNEDHIVLRNLELTNEASHLDEFGMTKKLNGFGGEANSWGSGRDVRFGVKVVADDRSLAHFRMDSLFIHDIFPTPVNGNFVHQGYGIKFETRSNSPNATSTGACSLFAPGPNATWPRVVTVTTPDSADSEALHTIGLHVTALPLSGAEGRIVRTLADGSWYNGPIIPLQLGDNVIDVPEADYERTVRMQVSTGDVGFDALTVNGGQMLCDGTELDGEVRLISDVLVEGCEFERTGHYAIWVKSLGLVGIDAYKNEGITVRGCGFLHTGGPGSCPTRAETCWSRAARSTTRGRVRTIGCGNVAVVCGPSIARMW